LPKKKKKIALVMGSSEGLEVEVQMVMELCLQEKTASEGKQGLELEVV
jgi:hypothetical protein